MTLLFAPVELTRETGGFTLALAHDYRIMKDVQGKGGAMMCMNEIDFGASIPAGMMAILRAKIASPQTLRIVLLEGKRFLAPEALALGLVDDTAKDGPDAVQKALALGRAFAPKARSQAYGLIKAGIYQNALAEISVDRGNDGLGMHTSITPKAKM